MRTISTNCRCMYSSVDLPYECKFTGCGKLFAKMDELRRHKRIHKGQCVLRTGMRIYVSMGITYSVVQHNVPSNPTDEDCLLRH